MRSPKLMLVALDEGSSFELGKSMLVIGRHPQCDLRLDSIRVSRRHSVLQLINDEQGHVLEIRDLGSTNGVCINGQRVESGRAKIGDIIHFAHLRFRLQSGDAEVAHAAELATNPNLDALGAALQSVLPAELRGVKPVIKIIVTMPAEESQPEVNPEAAADLPPADPNQAEE